MCQHHSLLDNNIIELVTHVLPNSTLGFYFFLKIMASQTFWIGQKSSKQNSEKVGFVSKLISWRDLRKGLTGFVCPAQPTHASRKKFCEMFFGFVWWPQTGQKWMVYPCFSLCSGFAQAWGCQRQLIYVKRKQLQITTNWATFIGFL